MSGPPEDVAARLSDYVSGLFAREDAVLEEVRAEIARRGLPEIYVSAEAGRMLQFLMVAIGARRVLEIGALGGYSAIWMARALPADGRLVSLEIDPARADLARTFAARAGLGDIVEVQVGDARERLPLLRDEPPFDAVFIDADKEGYSAYLEMAIGLVRPGGLIVADNAFWSGRVLEESPESEATRALRAFNERLASDPRLTATIIPVGDGLAVAVAGGRGAATGRRSSAG